MTPPCSFTPDGDYSTTPPLLILPQMEITLLNPCLFTPDGDYPITPPLLIYPRWRLLYYTTPAHLPQTEITLLHHSCLFPQMEITLLHHPCSFTPDRDYSTTPPLLIYPRQRLPYFTTPAYLPQMEITL